mmetsp:Transcript_28972/g.67093  ORF Transcript_28972/g.67093 Transcript_28972/m.67093 type:complete len:637 (+) Transcript_28972:43-1953(+)
MASSSTLTKLQLDGNLFLGLDYPTVRSGQKVSGSLVLVLLRKTAVSELGITVRGMESAQLMPSNKFSFDETDPELNSEKSSLFDEKIIVWKCDELKDFEAGTYCYPFEWDLPDRVPSSYVAPRDAFGARSTVQYTAAAFIIAANCRLQVDSKTLKVLEALEPESLSRPVAAQSSKTFLLDFGGRGPTNIKVSIPQEALFVGERVPVTLDVDNPSSKRIDAISVSISEKLTVKAGEGTFNHSTVVLEHFLPNSSIAPRSSVGTVVAVAVPKTAQPSVDGVLIRVAHTMEVKLHSKLALACSVKVPVRIVGRSQQDDPLKLPTASMLEARMAALMGKTDVSPGELLMGSHSTPNQHPRKGGNEDRLVVSCTPCGSMHLLGVLDGHGGAEAAEFVQARLPEELTSNSHVPDDIPAALTDAFLKVDVDLLSTTDANAGACACICALAGNTLVCANIGDCRALVGKANGQVVCLTEDHRPSRPSERRRVEEAGGIIMHGRVYGILAVSRSFGDREFKRTMQELTGQEGEAAQCAYVQNPKTVLTSVTAIPEIRTHTLTPEDDFILIGCDGLFDAMSNEEAAAFVRKGLSSIKESQSLFNRTPLTSAVLTRLAHDLCMEAGRLLGHHDDITVLIVCPNHASS